MKTKLLFLLGIPFFTFTACDLNGGSNNTPEILFASVPIKNRMDSLNIYSTDKSGVFRLDSVHVGDTVSFHIFLYGYSNNLTSFYLTQSSDSVGKFLLPSSQSMDSIFLNAQSNYTTGKFLFQSGKTNVYFPFRYVTKKIDKDAQLTISLASDAHFDNIGSNSVSIALKIPIVIKKDTIKVK